MARQLVISASLSVVAAYVGQVAEGDSFCDTLTPLIVPAALKPSAYAYETFLIYVDIDEDGNLTRALASPGSERTHVLGVDNLRAMLGEGSFQELRKLASEAAP